MKRLFLIFALLTAAVAQQTQTTNPLTATNSKYWGNLSFGFTPSNGGGLNLNVGAGTCFDSSGARVPVAASVQVLTGSTTNEVYLDSSCAITVVTTGYVSGTVPIAEVVTGVGTITSFTDDRTFARVGGGGTTYSGIAPIAVTGANISIQNATPVNVTSAYGFGTGFAALSTAGVASGNLVIGDANTGVMDSGELNLSVANHVLQNASDTQTWTVRGGGNGAHNAAIGALHLVGGNQTGVGGASSKGGEIQIRGGNNAGTNTASQAGWVYVEPGSSTAGGFQGGLLLHHVYLKGGGTSTQWYMQCLTASQMTVNDCGASPENWLGIAHDVSGTTVNVHVPPSESPVSASAPVTLGHTVCLGAASPQVTDSGGTSSCTSTQGVTVGVVIATSGGPVDIGDGTAVTFSTTLPLVSMNTAQSGSPGGTFTTVNGTTNQINSSAPSGPSTTLSLSSTLLFPGTITMGANAADFASATSFKIPSYAGGVTAADGTIAFNTTAKSFHGYQNGADAIFATYKSAPTNGQCATWITDGTTFVLGSVACATGTVTGTSSQYYTALWSGTSSLTGTAPVVNGLLNSTSLSAYPAYTATPVLGTDNSVAGTLQMANAAANAHTIWGSAATTSNTILGPATVIATGHMVGCTTSSTTCTLTDLGAPTGGTVTSGVAPIAVTGSAVSLQNSAAANVTAALGTDTKIFTASGSAATTSHIIEGDAQGGTTDAGHFTPQSQASAVGTCLSSYSNATGVFGTAPCIPGPQTIGGLIGGSVGGGAATNNAPWYGTSASAPNHIQSFSSWWSDLTIYIGLASGVNNGYVEYFITDNTTSASTKRADFGRLSTPSNPSVGAYTEHSGVNPFWVPGNYYSYMEQDVLSGGNGGSVSSWTALIRGSYAQPYDWVVSSTFALSSTRYSGPGYTASTTQTTENIAGIVIPLDGTWDYQCVVVNGAQSATGSLVATLDYTHSGATSASSVVTTIPAGSPANDNAYCDYAHTQATVAGDWISWKWVNNATATSTTVRSASVRLNPTTAGQTAIVWPLGTRTINNGQSTGPAFLNGTLVSGGYQTPLPHAGTMDNLYCLVTAAPGTNDETATIDLNGVPTALSATIPTTGCTDLVCSDTTHSFSFSALDTVVLTFNHAAGTTPAISSCSARITWS